MRRGFTTSHLDQKRNHSSGHTCTIQKKKVQSEVIWSENHGNSFLGLERGSSHHFYAYQDHNQRGILLWDSEKTSQNNPKLHSDKEDLLCKCKTVPATHDIN